MFNSVSTAGIDLNVQWIKPDEINVTQYDQIPTSTSTSPCLHPQSFGLTFLSAVWLITPGIIRTYLKKDRNEHEMWINEMLKEKQRYIEILHRKSLGRNTQCKKDDKARTIEKTKNQRD